MKKFLTYIIKAFLIIPLLASCAGIQGNNVKLENYSEVDGEDLRSLDLGYKYKSNPSKDGREYDKQEEQCANDYASGKKICYMKNDHVIDHFDGAIIGKLQTPYPKISELNPDSPNRCIVEIYSKKSYGFCPITNFLSPFTLMILPYYCQHKYEAKATLISTSDNRILKEYYLKNKAHEVWSSLWFLSAFVIDSWGKGPTPEGAKEMVEQNISEALARSIINDASQFPECQKDQASLIKKK